MVNIDNKNKISPLAS